MRIPPEITPCASVASCILNAATTSRCSFTRGVLQQLGEKRSPECWPQDEFSLFSIGNVGPSIT